MSRLQIFIYTQLGSLFCFDIQKRQYVTCMTTELFHHMMKSRSSKKQQPFILRKVLIYFSEVNLNRTLIHMQQVSRARAQMIDFQFFKDIATKIESHE